MFKIGSEWRKWDLHIHTPFTKLNNAYKINDKTGNKEIWDLFCEKINDSDVSVFAITDYFSIDNYFTFIEKYKNKYPESKKIFFPNVELRLEVSVNQEAEEVNIHVIFSNTVFKKTIESFLSKLNTTITRNGAFVTCQDLVTNDFESASVNYNDIKKFLKQVFGEKDRYLILAAANNNGLRPNNNAFRKRNITDQIDKICDAFFGGKKNIKYFLDTSRYESDEHAAKKPVVSGCDAHSFEDIEKFLGKRVTWIKADLTFEGLKQIVYEPEERVFIGEKPPILDKIKNNKTKYLDYLKIDQVDNYSGDTWFKNIEMPFNKELVAIIGNKGSGKSAIADILGLVGNTHIDKKYFSFLEENKFLKDKLAENFKTQATWKSGGTSDEILLSSTAKSENPESVRFIPQNYFEELTNEIEISKFQNILEDIILGLD